MVLLVQNIIFFLLILLLVTGTKQTFSSPAIAFVLPFAISSFYLMFNISRWNVKLSDVTFFVILGGCVSFLAGVVISNCICQSYEKKNKIGLKNKLADLTHEFDVYVDNKLLLVFTLIQIFSVLIVFRRVLAVSKKYGYSGNISQLIYGYRFLGTYTTENLSLGAIGNLCYNFATAAGFVWVYILIHKVVNKNNIPLALVVNTVLSIVMCLLKGGRERAMQIVAAGLLYYLFFNKIRHKRKKELSPKQFAIVAIVGIAVMGSFQMLGSILGRTVQADPIQYIAVYLCGSIRNLDVYVRDLWGTHDVFGKMTFIRIINYIGGKCHNENWIYPLDLPYQAANGKNSGNIYTTFYAYLYDFGYIGVAIMPFFIGFITNFFYKIAARTTERNNNKINLSLLIYGYWYYTLLFSYFSNKFYEMTFTIVFIRNVIIWNALIYILKKGSSGTLVGRKCHFIL